MRECVITKKGEGHIISGDLGGLRTERSDEILKVVIVSLLYFISWVSGLCNNINIVFGVQLNWRRTS